MITARSALAATACLIALAFAASTFERWLDRRRQHELAWSISFLQFALASGALWIGAATGWSLPTFRAFFLFGAILNVPWLAVGTVYLHLGTRRGDKVAVVVAVLSGLAVGVMISAPTRGSIPDHGLPQGREVFGILPRVLAAVSSGVGATVVIVGAVWSAVRLVRSRPARVPGAGRLALGNLIIAVGTVILGASGTLQGRLGQEEGFSLTLAVGIAVLFAGFLVVTSRPPSRAAFRHERAPTQP